MSEMRTSLKRLLDGNSLIAVIKPAAFILLLLYPVFGVINTLTYLKFYSVLRAVFYVAYLFGLVLCFSEAVDWAIGAAFALNTLRYLIYMVKDPSLNYLVYIVFYGFIAFYFLRNVLAGNSFGHSDTFGSRGSQAKTGGEIPGTINAETAASTRFCPNCGHEISGSAIFCPFCGGACKSGGNFARPQKSGSNTGLGVNIPHFSVPVSPRTTTETQVSSPQGIVASVCGGGLSIVFTLLLTIYLAVNIIGSFSIMTLIGSIPMIIICAGCWIVFTSSHQNAPNPTGFTLISGGLVIFETLYCLLFSLFVVLGFILIAQGNDTLTSIGFGLILVAAVCAVLMGLYWNGLRRTVSSAKAIIQNGATEWSTSMYAIVMLCIGAIGSLISLLLISSIQSQISSLLYSVIYGSGLYTSSFGSSLIKGVNSVLYSGSWTNSLSTLLSIAVTILSIFILIQIRGKTNQLNNL